jgi:hypothetical protein
LGTENFVIDYECPEYQSFLRSYTNLIHVIRGCLVREEEKRFSAKQVFDLLEKGDPDWSFEELRLHGLVTKTGEHMDWRMQNSAANAQSLGAAIVSDDVGTVTGIFLVPNGRAPIPNSKFTDLKRQKYQTSGQTRSFPTGTRTLRFTSDPENSSDLSKVEGYAERTYTASGVVLDKEETIVSTRVPEFNSVTTTVATKTTRFYCAVSYHNFFLNYYTNLF